ncbi:glycosyltransferase family 1 protein [Thalassobaculum sp.]|uniref:glycosyltransferase family 4 protein n=1 Tax=Thalassobaculum sp. TaxID=2022740 RepID=UPI0032EF78A2
MTSILLVTDAWRPQVNGVVRSLECTAGELRAMGVRVEVLSPQAFPTVPCPTYPEIRLSLTYRGAVQRRMAEFDCEHLHIATEGPLGLLVAAAARRVGMPFTTSYHTRFPEYLAARWPVPVGWSYAWLRRFHNAGAGCMVATGSLRQDLDDRGFRNLMPWSRGVHADLFRPIDGSVLPDNLPRPIFINVGRVSVEKNIKAFLDLELPGSKVVVGDGPQLASLRRDYPAVHFTGHKSGEDLARHCASADVFVFPSLTDTFGLVLLEALSCGVPVAAFPVMGPRDVIGDSGAGVLSGDLRQAALDALRIPPDRCRRRALEFSWASCARQFLDNALAAQAAHKADRAPLVA